MTRPTWTIGVDWDGDGVYTDETVRVMDFTVMRGRDSELGAMQVGQATITLQNNDGRFMPEFVAGPLYGFLSPMKKVRISAVFLAVTYYLFTGYIDVLEPLPKQRVCVLHCGDAFMLYKKLHLNQAIQNTRGAHNMMVDVLTSAGALESFTYYFTGEHSFTYPYWRNSDLLSALQEIADNELGGQIFMDTQGRVAFRSHVYRTSLIYAGGGIVFSNNLEVEYKQRADMTYKRAILQAAGYVPGLAGSQLWSYLPLPVSIAPGATLEMDINYPVAATAVTTPLSGTDYLARDSATAGAGSDVTASLSSVFTNYGGGASWNLTNNGTVTAYLQLCQIRGTPLQLPTEQRSIQRTTQGSSLGPYDRTYEHSYRLVTRNQVAQYAEYIVNRYGPKTRPLLIVRASSADDTMIGYQLSFDINSLLVVVDNNQTWKTQVDAATQFFIERVEHTWRMDDAKLNTTWHLTDYRNDMLAVYDLSLYDDEFSAPYGY